MATAACAKHRIVESRAWSRIGLTRFPESQWVDCIICQHIGPSWSSTPLKLWAGESIQHVMQPREPKAWNHRDTCLSWPRSRTTPQLPRPKVKIGGCVTGQGPEMASRTGRGGQSGEPHRAQPHKAPRHGSQPPAQQPGRHDRTYNRGGRIFQASVHGGCPRAQSPACLLSQTASLQQGTHYVAVGLLGCMLAHRPRENEQLLAPGM